MQVNVCTCMPIPIVHYIISFKLIQFALSWCFLRSKLEVEQAQFDQIETDFMCDLGGRGGI